MNKLKRMCRCCGINLPAKVHYDSDWCWICWRRTWEDEHPRYYVSRKPKTNRKEGEWESPWIVYYEEVQSLRGVNLLDKKNQLLIQETMAKERELLNKDE